MTRFRIRPYHPSKPKEREDDVPKIAASEPKKKKDSGGAESSTVADAIAGLKENKEKPIAASEPTKKKDSGGAESSTVADGIAGLKENKEKPIVASEPTKKKDNGGAESSAVADGIAGLNENKEKPVQNALLADETQAGEDDSNGEDEEGDEMLASLLAAFSNRLHRPAKHVMRFLLDELDKSRSLDEQIGIVARFEQLLTTYIKQYVTCLGCKTKDTILSKQQNGFDYVGCRKCGSRAVSPMDSESTRLALRYEVGSVSFQVGRNLDTVSCFLPLFTRKEIERSFKLSRISSLMAKDGLPSDGLLDRLAGLRESGFVEDFFKNSFNRAYSLLTVAVVANTLGVDELGKFDRVISTFMDEHRGQWIDEDSRRIIVGLKHRLGGEEFEDLRNRQNEIAKKAVKGFLGDMTMFHLASYLKRRQTLVPEFGSGYLGNRFKSSRDLYDFKRMDIDFRLREKVKSARYMEILDFVGLPDTIVADPRATPTSSASLPVEQADLRHPPAVVEPDEPHHSPVAAVPVEQADLRHPPAAVEPDEPHHSPVAVVPVERRDSPTAAELHARYPHEGDTWMWRKF